MREKRIQIEGQDTPYLVRDDGTIWSEKSNRILKGTVKRNEYHTVYLFVDGRQYNCMVHRLVAEAFCDNPNNYTIVHHKDGNHFNNCAENLEWVTTQENALAIEKRKQRDDFHKFTGDLNDGNWKLIEGYPNYWINKKGEVINSKRGHYMALKDRNGYKRVSLTKEGKTTLFSVHRLVYEAFIGKIPENMYIDHIDGDKSNNNLSNLRLTTQSDNMKNSMANGHKIQISVLQFDKQGNFIAEYPTIKAAASAVGVATYSMYSAIKRNGTCAGYRWKRK